MKRIQLLFASLALFALFAMLLPDTAAAQTQPDATKNPGLFTIARPWLNDQATFTITHTAAAARVDTIALPGLRTTGQVLITRRTPPLASVVTLRLPTISMVSDTLFISWPAADSLTYDVAVTKRKRH